jgi:hypothetical protein
MNASNASRSAECCRNASPIGVSTKASLEKRIRRTTVALLIENDERSVGSERGHPLRHRVSRQERPGDQ